MGFEFITGPNFIVPLASLTTSLGSAISTANIVRGIIAGNTLSAPGSSTTGSVSAGQATDSTNVTYINLAASLSKNTASWVVGSGHGGLDTGSIANSTWYSWYVIQQATGASDALFSLSATSPTMPSGWVYFRRIGSMKTDVSGNWVAFQQFGDWFRWSTPVMDISATSISTTYTNFTLTVPPGLQVLAFGNINPGSGGSIVQIRPVGATDASVLASGASLTTNPMGKAGISANTMVVSWSQMTNASALVQLSGNVTISTYLSTEGWFDYRGRFS